MIRVKLIVMKDFVNDGISYSPFFVCYLPVNKFKTENPYFKFIRPAPNPIQSNPIQSV